ncbi:PTS glucitol/sorbitol transporter subunit IIA [Shouchella shacheensis]|uniref:PTS glucitol/sorbitol transporter subunit IIA n=1 Tax=Shouchella shacheensis TaxID=1649580 RepID=UPI00073FB0A7|nr:PTS glucitol/sorbitol transporter subunit IIA [Shouchella shacheensis]
MNIYTTVVTKLGPSASDFLADKMLILFKNNAPEELAEFCILHEENKLNDQIQAGDTLSIADTSFQITAVGSAVNKNLDSLGHITIKADGATEAELPGTLSIEDGELPEVNTGDSITVTRK